MGQPGRQYARWTCRSCNKQSYPTRKAARTAARRQKWKGRMPAYECPVGEGWHSGHLPARIRHGEAGRDIYDERYQGQVS